MWQDVRTTHLRVGDETPAGPIEAIEYYDLGPLGKVCIKIGGTWYDRTRYDVVSVKKEAAA